MSLIAAKSGYLDIKTPARSRGIRVLKAWNKRWVVLSSKGISPPCLIIQVYANHSLLKDQNCLFCKRVKAENATVYRSRSRTHRHAFSVAEDCDPVLHLAGSSESQSQEWMACMRDLLWPPNPIEQVNMVLTGRYEVSLIDNEFSCQTGMLGIYGHLAVTENKLLLTAPQTGSVIKEWHLKNIKRYQLVPQTCKEDSHKIFSIVTVCDSTGLSGQFQFFSVDSVSVIESMTEIFNQYRSGFESLLDSPIYDDHDLIQFDDVFQRHEATTDDELHVRNSLGSSGSTVTNCSDGPFPSRLLSLPDSMLDCSITSSQITQKYESHSYSPPSSPHFNYDNLDHDFPVAELESLLEDNRRFSSNSSASHIYSDISLDPSQNQYESIYEEIDNYQNDEKQEYHPPLPPRNFPVAFKQLCVEYADISQKPQFESSTILRKMFKKKSKNEQDAISYTNTAERALCRTTSTPVFYISLSSSQQICHSVSRSAPTNFLCFQLSSECTEAEHSKFSDPSENQLSSQSLKFRQRSRTCPGSNNELELLLTELSNSEPKHREFKQCLKTLSDGNLLASDFSMSTASCAELFSEFKRFSSDYCRMNPLMLDSTENKKEEFKYCDPDYMDMNGANSSIA